MAEPEENRNGDPVAQDLHPAEAPHSRRSVEAPAQHGSVPFRPHRGRLVVALLGVTALGVALLTAVLAVLGVVSPLVPFLCVVVAAGAVGALRALAIRSRRARVDRAFAEAMAPTYAAEPQPTVAEPPAPALPRRPTVLFDAEEASPRQASPMALRTAALSTASGSSAVTVTSEAGERQVTGTWTEAGAEPADTPPADARPWAPVDVPRPTYVESAKAERQAPAPLDLPEAPKAQTRTPIKAAEAAARRAESAGEPAAQAEVAGRRIDLDNVLQRRRA